MGAKISEQGSKLSDMTGITTQTTNEVGGGGDLVFWKMENLNEPRWRTSRCSHSMSPMNGGDRLRNASRPISIIFFPDMWKLSIFTP